MRGLVRVGEVGPGGTGESELVVGGLTCALVEAGVEECIVTGAGMRGGNAAFALRVQID